MESSDSMSTSGEFEIVTDMDKRPPLSMSSSANVSVPLATSPPTLNIAHGGLQELEQNLKEMIRETEKSPDLDKHFFQRSEEDMGLSRVELRQKYGTSVFYDCLDGSSPSAERGGGGGATTEKQDGMKPDPEDKTEKDLSEIDQECTIFSGVTYLGSININAPKSNMELQRKMCELNQSSDEVGLKVSVGIPNCVDGLVVLHDANTLSHIAAYEVRRIHFFARGTVGTKDESCFAFTLSHGDSQDAVIFQCHVFRCHIPEAVSQVSVCFARAFERLAPPSMTSSMIVENTTGTPDEVETAVGSDAPSLVASGTVSPQVHAYEFVVALEVKEKLTKTSSAYCAVPRGKSSFKIRAHCNKQIVISITQKAKQGLPPLVIERCFGVLLSPGKLVRLADMHLLDFEVIGLVHTNVTESIPAYQVVADWKATDKFLQKFNEETPQLDISVAIDLVIRGIQDPVRFVIETIVKVQSHNELRIMDQFFVAANSQKRALQCQFPLNLLPTGEGQFRVIDGEEDTNASLPSGVISSVTGVDVSPATTPSATSGAVRPNSFLSKMGIDHITKLVRSQSIVSMDGDENLSSPADYSSDGDEPMLSGTGEVSREMTQDTLEEWSRYMHELQKDSTLPKGVPNLVRAGIPEAIRGNVWLKLAGMDQRQDLIDNYRVLISRATNCEGVIQRDINRTFPLHKFFKDSGGFGQEALYKVSKAYAVYDNEVGYCQGLSFIAASLLLHMPEEDAFCVLVALMHKYQLRDLYRDGFESLYLRLFQLDCLIKEQLPKLHAHFQEMGIETHMFASQWFLTLYTARFPLYVVFHIIDLFLLDGMMVLFQVALTLLSQCEGELRQLDFEGILKYFRLQLPRRCRGQAHARKLMKAVCERKVKHLKKYEEKFREKRDLEERHEQETAKYEELFGEERKRLQGEIKRLEVKVTAVEETSNTSESIIGEYKQINLRQEQQLTELSARLDDLMSVVCRKCASRIPSTSPMQKLLAEKWGLSDADVGDGTNELPLVGEPARLGPLDPLALAQQRITELEHELAETKLAKVEAECTNQSLNHQLNATISEIQANRNSWQPWLSKKFNTIQEKRNRFVDDRRAGSVDDMSGHRDKDGKVILTAMESMSFDYK